MKQDQKQGMTLPILLTIPVLLAWLSMLVHVSKGDFSITVNWIILQFRLACVGVALIAGIISLLRKGSALRFVLIGINFGYIAFAACRFFAFWDGARWPSTW